MKLFRIALCLTMFAVAGIAMGQTKPGDMVIDVPFAFAAAGQQFPAGHYTVAAQGDLIRLSGASPGGLYLPTHAAVRTNADGSKLVFHRYGTTYFLAGVWVTGSTSGKELYRSRAERELAAHQAEMQLAEVRPAR
jgi:hypothetical protein